MLCILKHDLKAYIIVRNIELRRRWHWLGELQRLCPPHQDGSGTSACRSPFTFQEGPAFQRIKYFNSISCWQSNMPLVPGYLETMQGMNGDSSLIKTTAVWEAKTMHTYTAKSEQKVSGFSSWRLYLCDAMANSTFNFQFISKVGRNASTLHIFLKVVLVCVFKSFLGCVGHGCLSQSCACSERGRVFNWKLGSSHVLVSIIAWV